ncbi:MAG: hypothetical protein AABY83_08655 [Pseudomonadota bacterium]
MIAKNRAKIAFFSLSLVLTACGTALRDSATNYPPEAKSVNVALADGSAHAYVGSLLIGDYKYSDAENDTEGATQLQWLRDGQAIENATENRYTVVAADSGTALRFQVTPVDNKSEIPSTPVASEGIVVENSAPEANDIRLTSSEISPNNAFVGSVLTVGYTYSDRDNDEAAAATLRWWRAGTLIDGATEPSYTVTRADLDKAIYADVTPQAKRGALSGNTVTTPSISIINSAPHILALTIAADPAPAAVGSTLTASYIYLDTDLDAEASTFQWSNGSNVIDTQRAYRVQPSDTGKPLTVTVTPVAKSGLSPGIAVTSATLLIGNSAPVANAVGVRVNGATGTVKAFVGDTLRGVYSYSDLDLDKEGTTAFAWYRSGATVAVSTAVEYIVTRDDSGKTLTFEVTPIAQAGTTRGQAIQATAITIDNSAPQARNVTLIANATPAVVGSILTASYAYFDADGDIENGSVVRWLRSGAVITDTTGANYTTKDYTLVAADAGKAVTFEITPKAATGVLTGNVTLSSSISPNNSAPTASGVVIDQATASVGTSLTASFTFADSDKDAPGASLYAWRQTGAGTVIGTGQNYVVKPTDAHKSLSVTVTPYAATGTNPGVAITSPARTIDNSAPSITGAVNIVGNLYTRETLTASYTTFTDPDGDAESGTTYQWYRGTNMIGGATSINYTITSSDIGQSLTVKVTPKDGVYGGVGAVVTSAAVTPVNLAPVASNVIIAKNAAGDTVAVTYDYSDYEIDAQGATQIAWLRNGVTVGSGTTYALTPVDAGTTLHAQVTPVAKTGTLMGAAVLSNAITVTALQLNVSAGLKHLTFTWPAVTGATYYRVAHNPDGASGYTPLTGASNLTTTTFEWDIAVHRLNWQQGLFMVEACDASGCVPSAAVSALNVMLNTIGYVKASNTEAYDDFGYSVALSADGNTLAVGAQYEDSAATGVNNATPGQADNSALDSGAVYVYTRTGATWTQQAYVKASNTEANDLFGYSVALSADGNTLAVGAQGEDSAATGVYDLVSDSTPPGHYQRFGE